MNTEIKFLACRLCLTKNNDCINVFGEDGLSLHISEIVNKHLWFEVRKDDDQNWQICSICWTKVYDFHVFYTQIYEKHYLNPIKFELDETETQIEQKEVFDDYGHFDDDNFNDSYPEIQVTNKNDPLTEVKEEEDREDEDDDDDVPLQIRRVRKKNEDERVKRVENLTNETKIEPEKKIESNNEESSNSGQRPEPAPEKPKKTKKRKTRDIDPKLEDQQIREYYKMDCELCKKGLENFTETRAHYREVHNLDGYLSCCDRKFYIRSAVLEHIEWHKHPEDFTCKICFKKFWDKFNIKRHLIDVHTPEDQCRFKCPSCPKLCATQKTLNTHMIIHREKKFVCDVCGKGYPTGYKLKHHVKITHEEFTKDHVCDACGEQFRNQDRLRRHCIRKHSDIPRIQCAECGIYLKNKFVYAAHVKRHEESRQNITCEICNRPCPNRGALRDHQRAVHEVSRRYKCQYCDKEFRKPINLREHEAIHVGVDLYTCEHCPGTFKTNSALCAHRKKEHYEEWVKWRRDFEMHGPESMKQ